MKKQIVSAVALAGLSVASLAGAAEINVYGASAQFDFLNANAVKFVQQYCATTLPALATGNGNVIQYTTTNNNTVKNGVVTGTSCGTAFGKPAIPGSSDSTLTFRYNGIASGEGVQSINKTTPLDSEIAAGCSVAGQRRMAPTGQSTSPTITTGSSAAYQAATVCAMVNLGTSDVAFDQFDQFADDSLISADGSNTITPLPAFAVPTAIDNKTVAVPFAFYVNPGVTATHCINSLGKHTGGYCTSSNLEQCNTGDTCEGTATTIDNLSRLQANILYSGQVLNWNQLGGYFTSNPIKLCMRKPGSGTHVAFDKTVMRAAGKSGWGADYTTLANNSLANLLPYTYFNGSSTDMKKCLGGTDGTGVTFSGAIGYMDADTADSTVDPKYNQVKFNGVKPNRTNVRNGAYEFYSIGHMYTENNNALADAVAAYVQDPANVPSGKAKFWASVNEMNFARGLDTAYPSKGTPTVTVTP